MLLAREILQQINPKRHTKAQMMDFVKAAIVNTYLMDKHEMAEQLGDRKPDTVHKQAVIHDIGEQIGGNHRSARAYSIGDVHKLRTLPDGRRNKPRKRKQKAGA